MAVRRDDHQASTAPAEPSGATPHRGGELMAARQVSDAIARTRALLYPPRSRARAGGT
jgi:hypothetical protein